MAIKKELVALLACPKCKGAVAETPAGDGLACAKCAVVYPVRDGIPVMLVDQAVPDKEWDGSK